MRTVALIVACAAVVAACGSSGSTGAGTTSASSGSGTTIMLRVPSGAMEPTLHLGSIVQVEISSSYIPRNGDVIALHPPSGALAATAQCGDSRQGAGHQQACSVPTRGEATQTYFKRIVAGPGDSVAIVAGHVIRNGRRVQDSSYTRPCAPGDPTCSFPATIKIPRGNYFVLGDNRGASDDSRFWGPVPRSYIIGKVRG